MIAVACKQANHRLDLANFVKAAQTLPGGLGDLHAADEASGELKAASSIRFHQFQSPSVGPNAQIDPKNLVS